ncbi:MAG: hypothetical protein K1Y02_05305 [Candidatus Hydrogenedentes bacterium]|nr:hypothetical protein [Candidatus Hydrogenedentota bacterium]
MSLLRLSLRVSAITLVLIIQAFSTFIEPDETVPLERLVKNYQQYVSEHPDDIRGYYWVARAYSLGFALAQQEFGIWNNERPDEEPTMFMDPYQGERKTFADGPASQLSQRKDCLVQALRWFRKGITHISSSSDTWYVAGLWLGLGWMYEEGAQFAGDVACPIEVDVSVSDQREILRLISEIQSPDEGMAEHAKEALFAHASSGLLLLQRAYENAPTEVSKDRLRAVLRRGWEDRAIEAYKSAYKPARTDSLKYKSYSQTAIESAKGIRTILESRGKLTAEEKQLVKKLGDEMGEMGAFSRSVTPIVFSLSRVSCLPDLIDSRAHVSFDLDGFGGDVEWPWVKPDTLLLVWDPKNTGQIDSGRRLIGTATWWMFWRDGFDALRALDDNNDGWLEGDEMHGLGTWQDRNGNAKSDEGEVVPIEATSIARLAVFATETEVGGIGNPHGLALKNGNVLPLYDWIPQSKSRKN